MRFAAAAFGYTILMVFATKCPAEFLNDPSLDPGPSFGVHCHNPITDTGDPVGAVYFHHEGEQCISKTCTENGWEDTPDTDRKCLFNSQCYGLGSTVTKVNGQETCVREKKKNGLNVIWVPA